jgi:hypothetical protein
MGIATALIFLAEASAMCGAAAPGRLGGGAQVAPAILEFDQDEPQSPSPTVAAGEKQDAAPGDKAPAKRDHAPANQCKTGPLAIA